MIHHVDIDIIGSWFAFDRIEMLINIIKIKQIDLFDDENCHKVTAQYINHFDMDFKIAQFSDAFERKDWRKTYCYQYFFRTYERYGITEINFIKIIQKVLLLVLQSNLF